MSVHTIDCEVCGRKFDSMKCPYCARVESDTMDMLYEEAVQKHPAATSGAMREKLAATPYDLMPFQETVEAYCRVAEFGAKKYAPWNWSKGLSRVQLLGSMFRHAFAYLRGEDHDKETGLLHTDHILWNAVALSHNVHWKLEDGRRAEPERAYKNQASITVDPDEHYRG